MTTMPSPAGRPRPWLSRRPGSIIRFLARLPARAYDLHLGPLLGHRFLLLTHQGRKSGRRYRTVLEVVQYDPVTRESVVAAGWGHRADWYRNLQARPAVEVRTGADRYTPGQRFLDVDEVEALLRRYEREHEFIAWLFTYVLGFPFFRSPAQRRAAAERLPMVAFRPAAHDEGKRNADGRG